MDVEYTGKLIAELRKEKGLTQKQLAERLHVTDKAVSKWERGLNFPDLMLLDSLSAELGATTSLLTVAKAPRMIISLKRLLSVMLKYSRT